MERLIVATNNNGKLEEISAILGSHFCVLGMKDAGIDMDIEENGSTFVDNARIKARAIHELIGGHVLADDSGLCIDALNGAPGIYSARFGGPGLTDAERCELLLEKMAPVPDGRRCARFVCVMAVARPDAVIHTAEGICEGSIIHVMRGNQGFGYDPVFLVGGTDRTMAELSLEEKNRISHRARALEATVQFLEKYSV